MPETHQVDLNNLPGPGDPGAPVPPDELDNDPAQGSYFFGWIIIVYKK